MTINREYKDLFISYSKKDSELVLSVVKTILDCGFSIWIDNNGIESVNAFKSVIVRAIKKSDIFLFFSSKTPNNKVLGRIMNTMY